MDGLSQSVITLAASFASLIFGSHLADILIPNALLHAMQPHEVLETQAVMHDSEDGTQEKNAKQSYKPENSAVLQISVISTFILCWLATILICIYVPKWRGIVMFALILAPAGTWIRFYLSQINASFPRFPFGTFAANMIGTAVLASCLALQRSGSRGELQCQVLQGIDDGFCGCLTTVSTLVIEISKLDRPRSYLYVVASYGCGQVLMLLILGGVDFARRGLEPRCRI